MEDIQFVLEAPHLATGQKKRPRLVTSCDNCRLKKVKCIQTTSNTQCEACTLARVPCRFHDREKYFAERRKIMAGGGEGSRRQSSTPEAQSDSWSPTSPATCSVASPASPHHSRSSPHTTVCDTSPISRSPSYTVLPQTSSHRPRDIVPYPVNSQVPTVPSQQWAERGSYAITPPYRPYPAVSEEPHRHPAMTALLFDPDRPERPNSVLMAHLIQDFFSHLSSYFPFLNYEETLEKFFNQTLSSLMENCIAALAVRYTTQPDIKHGISAAVEAYCTNAESILASIIHGPSLENLHSLILLSWIEFKRNRSTAFCAYAQMAVQMALDVGLSNDKMALASRNEHDRQVLQATWASVSQLNTTANSMRL